MKDANLVTIEKLREISSDNEFNRKRQEALKKDDDIEVLPTKSKVQEREY